MRILRILCGIAVLFTSLTYGHLLHHHVSHASPHDYHSPLYGVLFLLALCAGILSVIGALLLLKTPR